MTLKQAKKTALALIAEYDKTNPYLTGDDEIQQNLNLILNISYQELSDKKPIRKMILIDRTTKGDLDYSRAYSLPADMKKLDQIVAYDTTTNKSLNPIYEIREGVATTVNQVTTYSDKIYINDLEEGNYYVKYFAYPTQITENTAATFELELDKDVQMLLPFAVAGDILMSDADDTKYIKFANRYKEQLLKFNSEKSTGTIIIDNSDSLINF